MINDFLLCQVTHSPSSLISTIPLTDGLIVYTDGSKQRGILSVFINDKWIDYYTLPQISPQRAELAAIILALRLFPTTLNIITDSQYIAKLVPHISVAVLSPHLDSNLLSLFLTLQTLLQHRTSPIFLAHIRSHTKIPGPLTQGDTHIDTAVRSLCPLFSDAVESHGFFHQNACSLMKMFSIFSQRLVPLFITALTVHHSGLLCGNL